jgi:hypothetical protein
MTTRTFAPWVEPIAESFREHRAALVELVRSIPHDRWSGASPNAGWTYRDLLGHVATRDARDMRVVLNAVISKTRLDPAELSTEEDRPINDRLLAELEGLSVEQIASHIERDTDGLLDLMAKLAEDDGGLRQRDFPMSLSEALARMPDHERMHMEQLRTALEGPS